MTVTNRLEALIASARTGDTSALSSILSLSMPLLERRLEKRVGAALKSRESVSDLAQSVCREVLQDLEHFELRGAREFRAWLFECADRKIVDRYRFYRAAKRDMEREAQPESGFEATGHNATPSRHAVIREEVEELRKALDKLPEMQRECLVLHRIVGLSYEEVGQRIDRSPSAVRGLVARALASISIDLE